MKQSKAGPHLDSRRAYRESLAPLEGETAFQVTLEQTDLRITAKTDLSREVAAFVHGLRGEIKAYIAAHPDFLESLEPVKVVETAPDIVRAMARAARTCNVGPMAAVAGAVAQAVADHFHKQSPDILVENGGDLYMHSTRERVVALLAEPESGARLGLTLPAGDFPLALCASSATIGHSLSLGTGELTVVRAKEGALADAAATALNNLLRSPRDLRTVTDMARDLPGVDGVFAQHGAKLAVWGEMELAAIEQAPTGNRQSVR